MPTEVDYEIGEPKDLLNFSTSDLQQFYQKQNISLASLIIIIAKLNNTPIGFIASAPNSKQIEWVSYSYVLPFFKALHIEKGLRDAQAHYVLNNTPYHSVMHKLSLAKEESHQLLDYQHSGWKVSDLQGISIAITIESALSTSWFNSPKLNPQHEFILWDQLKDHHKQQIRDKHLSLSNGWYPEELDPFKCVNYHRDSSFVLTKKNNSTGELDVIGWIITKPSNDTHIGVPVCFIDPKIQSTGCVLMLWLRTFQSLQNSPYNHVHFYIPTRYPKMINFVIRRMLPSLTKLDYIWYISREREVNSLKRDSVLS